MKQKKESKKLLEPQSSKERKSDLSSASYSLEDYYNSFLTDDEIKSEVSEYGSNLEKIQAEFIEKTRIKREDLGFLFVATMLQCARIYIINRLTQLERANAKGGREDRLHAVQTNVLGKFSEGGVKEVMPLHASLEAIITTRGVPYDATAYANENLKLFKGANHRFSTIAHDPVLGLIVGPANILTSTITTNKKLLWETHSVVYDGMLKNPKIERPVLTVVMLKKACARFNGDISAVVAAVIKHLIHIATDLYTPCGITLPGAGLVLNNSTVEKLTKYVSTGDLIKYAASAGIAELINVIIATVHGCILLQNNEGDEQSFDLRQVRTKKIITYSNLIASSSNIIQTAITKDMKKLDIGGLGVTLYHLFKNGKFISDLEQEFLNNEASKIYLERFAEVSLYFEE